MSVAARIIEPDRRRYRIAKTAAGGITVNIQALSEHLYKYLCSTLPAAVFTYDIKKDAKYNGRRE